MLANFRQLLDAAQAGHYAVGAYDLMNLEMLEGILDAAEESDTPVILQFAQVFEGLAGLDVRHFGKAVVSAAEAAKVPVAVMVSLSPSTLPVMDAPEALTVAVLLPLYSLFAAVMPETVTSFFSTTAFTVALPLWVPLS